MRLSLPNRVRESLRFRVALATVLYGSFLYFSGRTGALASAITGVAFGLWMAISHPLARRMEQREREADARQDAEFRVRLRRAVGEAPEPN